MWFIILSETRAQVMLFIILIYVVGLCIGVHIVSLDKGVIVRWERKNTFKIDSSRTLPSKSILSNTPLFSPNFYNKIKYINILFEKILTKIRCLNKFFQAESIYDFKKSLENEWVGWEFSKFKLLNSKMVKRKNLNI